MKIYSLHVNSLGIPERDLKSILTTCVEGGSAYWLAADSVERDEEFLVTKIVNPVDAETRQSFDENNFQKTFGQKDIDLDTIHRGLQLILNSANLHPSLVKEILLMPYDKHDLDAGQCDEILQIGFFGEVIFG